LFFSQLYMVYTIFQSFSSFSLPLCDMPRNPPGGMSPQALISLSVICHKTLTSGVGRGYFARQSEALRATSFFSHPLDSAAGGGQFAPSRAGVECPPERCFCR